MHQTTNPTVEQIIEQDRSKRAEHDQQKSGDREARIAAGKVITVYTRLGPGRDDSQRILSFRPIDDDIDRIELLRLGFALDGNEVIGAVRQYQEEGGYRDDMTGEWVSQWETKFAGPFRADEGSTFADALGWTQLGLVDFFEERGYTVQFA